MLSRMLWANSLKNGSRYLYQPFRAFAAQQVPEPLSISALHDMGRQNFKLTTIVDYSKLTEDTANRP